MTQTAECYGPQRRASFRQFLVGDHERLDELFEELLAAFDADARDDAARLWGEFDAGISAHMDLEERALLPAFGAHEPVEAAALLREHAQIRETLINLGVGVDLHLTHADLVHDFVELLRSHARREDAIIYRWAERVLDEKGRELLREGFGQVSTPANLCAPPV